MKKIIICIIMSVIMISSSFSVSANDGKIVELFDLYSWVEEYSLGLVELEAVSFQNPRVQRTYDEFLIVDTQLRSVFMQKYRSREISYYQMQDLITAYNNFVYHTGRTFSYISDQQNWLVSSELDNALKNSYSKMRSSYLKVVHIMSK